MYNNNNINTISIPMDHYENLISSTARLDILLNAYQHMDRYDVEKVMEAVFGVNEKYMEDNT